ncbi:NAD+ synthase [Synechococcus sp. PCC 7336]|uniref:NAD+ synthase n=1 Tax=Synechococcus sp. PCC 7336 TaxID=195250 RepID=UPI00037AB984|nr:NAD+ synthase [Synechococcus sp. PCC 7336]
MKIALLQLNPIVGDLAGNAELIRMGVARATQMGAELAVTSELALLGYPPRDLLLQEGFVRRAAVALEELARSLVDRCPAIVGTVERNPKPEGRPLYNSAAWLEGGQVKQVFHKRLLPTYDVFDEDRYFEPTQQLNAIEYRGLKIGLTICEDIWNDRDFWQHRRYAIDPVAEMAQAETDVLINLSASPFSAGKQDVRVKMMGSMARKHRLPLLYVNQVGGNDDLVFDGASCAFDRDGTLFASGAAFKPDVVLADLAQMSEPIAVWPSERAEELYGALVLGTRDYVRKCGFERVLLGLSGGIDSAVTAAIAVAALGADNVLGVLMPSPYSSRGSIEDAEALEKNLGIETQTIPIEPMMAAFERSLAGVFAGMEPGVAEENLQSRIRGNLLMALSNKFGRLLLTTGNKSELAVGYCTIYGDMSGGLAVISDVPKTQVYELARWMNRQGEVIPVATIEKPPSAELKPDQQDSDSLPPYEVLDEILRLHVELHWGAEEIVGQGFEAQVVERVLGLVKRAEFKRSQAAPGLRVTDRAFGTGWRMAIARR